MADYQDIRGLRVKYLSADPSVTVGGEVWYNSTTGTLRSKLITEGVSSGANLTTARAAAGAGGIQTAQWVAGGTPTGPPIVSILLTEEYNGSGWTAATSMSTARSYFGGAGPQTAGIAVGGHPPATGMTTVESYNGSTWAGETAIPVGVWTNCTLGTEPACVSIGDESPSAVNQVHNYDGSTWTTGGTMDTVRSYVMGGGTQTAGIINGGAGPGKGILTETYDGSSWTAEAVSSNECYNAAAGGTQTSLYKAGGHNNTAPTYNTDIIETYDGTNWSTSPATLATGRGYTNGTTNGPSAAGLISGGTIGATTSTSSALTEEWNRSTNVITAGAWAAGGALNTARRYCVGFGTPTTAVAATGYVTTVSNSVEEYDGDTWTAATAIGNARYSASACGTLTAGLVVGGAPGTPLYDLTEEYDGTNWTTSPGTLNTGRMEASAFGIQTAAVLGGGSVPGGIKSGATEEYDGTNWTTSPGSLNTPRKQLPCGGAGTLTAGITFGGNDGTPPAPAVTGATETYDGSTWTSGGSLLTARSMVASGLQGTTTSALCISGPTQLLVESYDGTAWATNPSTTVVHGAAGGVGTQSTGMVFGGRNPGTPTGISATELFTGETSAANIETLTTS